MTEFITIRIEDSQAQVYPLTTINFNTSANDGRNLLVSYVAGEMIPAYSIVVVLDGVVYVANPNNLNHSRAVTGITTISAATGEGVEVISDGVVTNSSWSLDSSNSNRVFLGLNGSLTTAPVWTASFLIEVGQIVSPTQIIVDIQDVLLL